MLSTSLSETYEKKPGIRSNTRRPHTGGRVALLFLRRIYGGTQKTPRHQGVACLGRVRLSLLPVEPKAADDIPDEGVRGKPRLGRMQKWVRGSRGQYDFRGDNRQMKKQKRRPSMAVFLALDRRTGERYTYYVITNRKEVVTMPEIKLPAVRKKCSSCGKRKGVKAFGVRSDNGKFRNQCRECISKGIRVPKK